MRLMAANSTCGIFILQSTAYIFFGLILGSNAVKIPKFSKDLEFPYPFLELRQDLYQQCTVHISNPLKFGSSIDLYKNSLEACHKICVTLTSTTDIDIPDLSQIYYKVFQHQKYQEICTIQLLYLEEFQPAMDFELSFLVHPEISVKKPVHSTYVFIFAKRTHKKTEISEMYTTLAENMLGSVLTLIDMENNKVYLGCFACQKPKKFIRTLENYADAEGMENVVSFVDVTQHRLRSIPNLHSVYNSLHRDWKQLGVEINFGKVSKSGMKIELRQCNSRNPYLDLEEKCILYDILLRNNCSSEKCRQVVFNNFQYLATVYVNSDLEDHFFGPFGAQFEGLKFSLILSSNEKNGQNFRALLLPLSYTVWFYIVLAIFCLTFVLSFKSRFGRHLAWFWVVAGLLEKGCDLKCHKNLKIMYLFIVWLFATFLLRNFYTSDMYSHLTKIAPPKNLPESIQEIFRNTTIPVYAETGLAAQLRRHLKLAGNSTASRKSIIKAFNKVSTIRTLVSQSPSEFIENVTHSKLLPCEGIYDPTDAFLNNCESSGRFSLLSLNIGWRKPHSTRFLLPALKLFLKRKIYEPTNSISYFMAKPKLWHYAKKYFFHSTVEGQIGRLVDSGIFGWYKDNYDVRLQTQIIKGFNERVGLIKMGNVFAYAEHTVKKVSAARDVSDSAFGAEIYKGMIAIYHGGRENPAHLLESEVGLWSFTKVEVFSTKPPVESLRECSGENPESLSIMGAEKILPLFWSQRSDFRVLRKFEVFSTEPPVESLRECSGENPESLSIMGAEKTLPVSWSRRSDFGGLRKLKFFQQSPL
ncbi:unnamed protein product [Orchesella dallaii]|uniref:Uncharacterized protein n=1 Tax=Orchesella dallaii TaxID=48710 RepID=A0ABP1PL62_9HEXA